MKQARNIALNSGTQPCSEDKYLQDKVESYNCTDGNLNKIDGYNCDYCHNRGHMAVIVDGEMCTCECPKCSSIRKCIRFFSQSGLAGCKFENFKTECEWQKSLLKTVKDYSAHINEKWFFIGGQSGSGKTHLCTAIIQELIFNHQKEALLFEWAEKSKKLKQLINDQKYDMEINKYKTVTILYIDDLFKTKRGETATAADINLAFEIIDYRYRNNLITIISSEFSIDDIISIDEATGGRIKHKAQECVLYINKDKNKNYRLK